MKQLINFVLTGVVLYVAAILLPQNVQIADTKTLIFASFLLFVAEIVVVLMIFLFMTFSLFTGNGFGIIASVIGIFFAEIISLSLVADWLPGLVITGFWTKFFVALALSIFRVPEGSQNN